MKLINALENTIRDVRYGLRALLSSPGFTLVAVITLALAIGANAVVFGVLNALILRPLNVPQAESLYGIQHGNEPLSWQSYLDYLDLRDRNRSFDDLAAYNIAAAGLDTGINPSRVWLEEVSGNYFDVLGIPAYLGRVFHSADEHGPNSAPYIVLSYAYWHSYFADDRSVVGRTVRLNKHPFTIIGVLPPEFHGTLLFFFPDLFVPIVNQEQVDGVSRLNARDNRWVFMVMGHLKPGVTLPQATADLNSVGSYLEKTYPKDDSQRSFTLVRPGLYGDFLGRPIRAFLTVLMVLSGLILLAACANLGSLFAARSSDRSREVALRLALGSSRKRNLQGLFTEALLISLIGGAVGLIGSIALLHALSSWQPVPRFPIRMPLNPDSSVYSVTLVLALVSGFLFGIVPMRQVLRADPYQIVKSGSSERIGRRFTFRDLLLGIQVAICAVLVTSSLVAVRGLMRSLHSNFGFEPQNALLMDTVLDSKAGYEGDTVPVMQKRMINAIEKLPGVTSVGLIASPPLVNGGWIDSPIFADEAADLRPSNALAVPVMYKISPEYLNTAQTALLAGRGLTWHDDKNAPRVGVINREFAHRIFGSVANAIGKHYKMPDAQRIEVVGVVEDGKYKNLTEDPQSAMFLPILQWPASDTSLVVRSNRDLHQLATAMRNTLRELDPGLTSSIQTWSEGLNLALFPSRVATLSLGVLGGMGAMLSITGIFGMAAYSVSRRLRELGIRVALGAQRKEVLRVAVGRSLKLLAFGSVAGLFLGILASRVLAFIVYQATPRDPLVLAGVVVGMSLLGLLATWIPAHRALSVDPLILLREQ